MNGVMPFDGSICLPGCHVAVFALWHCPFYDDVGHFVAVAYFYDFRRVEMAEYPESICASGTDISFPAKISLNPARLALGQNAAISA